MPRCTTLKPGVVTNVHIDFINLDVTQPRKTINSKKMHELVTNIRATKKIEQPIIVQKSRDKGYLIYKGERRYKAAVIAELSMVPVILSTDVSDGFDRKLSQVSENVGRADLNAIDWAHLYDDFLKEGFKTGEVPSELKKYGITVSRSTVSNRIRLLELPKKIQDHIVQEKLSESHGLAILNACACDEITDWITKEYIPETLKTGSLSVSQLNQDIEKMFKKSYYEISDEAIENLDAKIKKSMNITKFNGCSYALDSDAYSNYFFDDDGEEEVVIIDEEDNEIEETETDSDDNPEKTDQKDIDTQSNKKNKNDGQTDIEGKELNIFRDVEKIEACLEEYLTQFISSELGIDSLKKIAEEHSLDYRNDFSIRFAFQSLNFNEADLDYLMEEQGYKDDVNWQACQTFEHKKMLILSIAKSIGMPKVFQLIMDS